MRIKSLLLALPLLLLAACDDEDLVTTTEETPPANDNIIDVEHEVAHFSTLTRSIAFMPDSVADNMRSAMPGTAVSFRLEGEMLFQNVPIISHESSDIFNDLCLVMDSDSAFMLLDGYPDITTLGNPDAAEAERADNAAARQTEWERFISYLRSQGRLEWNEITDSVGSDSLTIEEIEARLMAGLREMNSFAVHKYQYQRSFSIEVFAGYTTVVKNIFTFGGAYTTTYSNNAWMNFYSAIVDKTVFAAIHDAYFYAEEFGKPEWKALAMIAHCLVMSQLADFYGPMPFYDYRSLKETPPITYIGVEEIYNRCFYELKEAADILNERKPSASELEKVEGPYGGITNYNYLQWVKFANSLRLRLAMNIVKVDPSRAQLEAEAAVNEVGGVFDCGPNGEVTDQDFHYVYYSNQSGYQHPLYQICYAWSDSRLGASLENIMKRLRNPLLGVWFSKNTHAITNSAGNPSGYEANQDWVGVRQGVSMVNTINDTQYYGPFSKFKVPQYPATLMHVTEVLFARAEGALRGWNMGGTAQDWYERGIRRCMLAPEHSIPQHEIDAYLYPSKPSSYDYVDPYNEINNIDGRVEINVAWDDTESNEVKLEKIITQRYIAIFPQSPEAWTTFRRTGYPRLFPVDPDMNQWSDDINCEVQIRRIPYYSKDPSAQADLDAAAAILASESSSVGESGNNSPMTRIWWDINTDEIDYSTEEGRVIPHNF